MDPESWLQVSVCSIDVFFSVRSFTFAVLEYSDPFDVHRCTLLGVALLAFPMRQRVDRPERISIGEERRLGRHG
jgi:hypothetical protein